ncbi:uncharacterized protein Z518_06631 [Rhinocladiella mackenziei CBS 650.93]|uniref:Rhinocladiella mackenziei CBS 650.93 unplaced genomic scaffold supercont1.5, whole genome shotgun sequence n=1 Tax=Rhinocladiella mackenziei CBS 650.93 TaxID=1442369 RepID=A0A0D2IIG5_9EURO|nr:uncharacterized protein Z518_06631 [Rhinocladiella mackenziei CBS 650.93]KIX03081.1 hypothetical protein Z518_06631 [Rhinocladiella mackenziei CBS 650.93]
MANLCDDEFRLGTRYLRSGGLDLSFCALCPALIIGDPTLARPPDGRRYIDAITPSWRRKILNEMREEFLTKSGHKFFSDVAHSLLEQYDLAKTFNITLALVNYVFPINDRDTTSAILFM